MSTKVVYVVEVEVPDDFVGSAIDASAKVVMESVRTETNLPCRAWVTIAGDANAVLAIVAP